MIGEKMLTKNSTRSKLELDTTTQSNNATMTRTDFIRRMVLLTGAIATGCSPVKILLNSYSDKYDKEYLQKRILSSFVSTVIPGAEQYGTVLSKIYLDGFYPFAKRCGYFTSDLCNRSKELFRSDSFDELSFEERTLVIQSGLNADSLTKKLYTAAVYMAQVSFYCNIYNDDGGCELIDFKGAYSFMDIDIVYPDCSSLLANEITSTGNYS